MEQSKFSFAGKEYKAFEVETDHEYNEHVPTRLGYATGSEEDVKQFFEDRNIGFLNLIPINVRQISQGKIYWVWRIEKRPYVKD